MTSRSRSLAKPTLCAAALMLLVGLALTVENAAQSVDTGWAVSKPTTIVPATSSDPRQRLLLQDLLEQTQRPLITRSRTQSSDTKSLSGADSSTNKPSDAVRFAVRPDGIAGWQSAGPTFPPLNDSQTDGESPQTGQPAPSANDAQSAAKDTRDDRDSIVPRSPDRADNERKSPLEPGPNDTADDKTDRGAVESSDEAAASNGNETKPRAVIDAPAPPPLTPQLTSLRSRVRSVLSRYYRKTLNSRDHDPWEVMHGMLSYGVQSRIQQGGPRGTPITSVGWLCYNKPCKNLSLLYVTPKGELRAKYGVGLQGHLGQFLAMLAQCRVAPDYPIRVGKKQFAIQDLIEAEKKTCYPKSELTFKLISFQYYLDLNEKWVNDQGLEWDIPRVIREELAQPIRGAACGGTHRLSSLSLTVKARVRRGESLDGEYARAAEFVQKYHQYAFRLQNRDGSLSTAWFQGRGDDSDINRRIKTTGHILEWLCYSLSDEELRQPQTIRAVTYLANLMYSKYNNEWEVGPMCHAIHALLVYDERVFQPFDGPDFKVAYRPHPSTANRTQPSSARR